MPIYSDLLFVDNVPKERKTRTAEDLHGCINLDFCCKVCVERFDFAISVDPTCLVLMLWIAKGDLKVWVILFLNTTISLLYLNASTVIKSELNYVTLPSIRTSCLFQESFQNLVYFVSQKI